jgi:hypothetical protein
MEVEVYSVVSGIRSNFIFALYLLLNTSMGG